MKNLILSKSSYIQILRKIITKSFMPALDLIKYHLYAPATYATNE